MYHSLVESELHDGKLSVRSTKLLANSRISEQGTTEKLSKFWMQLDQYTKETVAGLRRGDFHVASGKADEVFKIFEKEGLNDAW